MIGKLSLKYKPDLTIIGVALLYYLSARLGYFFAFEDSTTLPAWPPSGIGFALIILLGRAAWPGITIGSLIANLMANWNDPGLPAQTVISISTIIAIGHTLEAVVGNYFMKQWIKDDYPFANPKYTFRFFFISMIMCLVGAGIGTTSLFVNSVGITPGLMRTGFSWWLGNVVGILLFTPFILAGARKINLVMNAEKAIEAGIFLFCIGSISLLLQVDYLNATMVRAIPFLTIPFLLWLAFRFELIVALSGVLAVSLLAIYITTTGAGPFVLGNAYNSMLLLQIFVCVMCVSTIILSATVKERGDTQRKLEEFNENLESMVLQRTKLLNEEITTRKDAEARIYRTNQELSKRNTELDHFVYSVSHDLRAPIASVLGLINLAKKDPETDMKDMYLDMIHNSTMQQDDFIKEILDQSRNSRLDVKRDEINFESLIEETFSQLRYVAHSGQVVQKVVEVNQHGPFYSDKWRLKVILNNIISNSIRYRNGRDPVIEVSVTINNNHATLSIRDNGKGIGKDHLPNIYKMFYRGTDDGAGSGLGLYIVKETVDKLNGHIHINSVLGTGTTVTFDIPELEEDRRENYES
ncbi:MAG: MASE1 domain-containing protein [Chryseolinea sp.]